VLSEESRAHPAYRARLLDADETVLTELFGMGWAAPHRVVGNAATRRWLARGPRGPSLVRAANRLLAPVLRRLPEVDPLRFQRAALPFFAPNPPTDDRPAGLVEVAALYAGETVARLHDVRPAGPLTRELAAA
jgi:nitronate monooxygenase